MELEKIEKEIFNQLLAWVKNNKNLTKEKVKDEIIKMIKARNYLEKDYEVYYAKERIEKKLLELLKSKQESIAHGLAGRSDLRGLLGWGRHFSGRNILINGLISFIPVSIIYSILSELGFGGVLILLGLMFGIMYLTGTIIEKIMFSINRKNN